MPRDVDSAVASLENVFLYNLDDLAQVAAQNRQARLVEAEAGRNALVPRTDALWSQLQIQLTTLPEERLVPLADTVPLRRTLSNGALA